MRCCMVPGCGQDTRLLSGKDGWLCLQHWFRLVGDKAKVLEGDELQ